MKSRVIAAGTALLVLGSLAQELKPAPREWVEAVEALVGDKLTAKPLKARRILVFWRCEGFVHRDSIILGNETFEIAARKTGAFKVDLTRDYAALRAENLARYDALVLNNTTALKTDDPANSFIEPALLEYIRSGRGLAVIHAGADNFYKAGACAEMVGGLFLNHPWDAGGTWAFKVEEPDHPCCATSLKALAPVFKFSDEIYQQRSPFYNRPKLRVLVSLDLSDKATAEARGQQRADGDYAVSWVRPYGKGRVFYTSFAHDQRAWMHREILWHMLDGLQYAIGDLKADDTPHGLSEADLARIRATPDEAAASEIYAFLQDTLAHTGVKSVDEANIAKLRRLLTEPASTVFGRKAILRALMAVNSSITPTDITPFLKSATTRAWAIQTLAWLPGKAATETLAQALGDASDDERIELLGALALRRASAPVLTCLKDNNPQVAGAAMAALGQIADKAAVAALAVPAQGQLEAVRVSALAAALGGMTTRGEARRAAQTAKEIFKDRQAAPALRAAAARTLLVADARFFELAMEDPCPLVRGAVLRDTSNVPLKNLAHTHDKFSARALDLFRAVGDERSHTAVADTIFKRDGLKLFDQLQALLGRVPRSPWTLT